MTRTVIRRIAMLALLWGAAATARFAPHWATAPGFCAAAGALFLPGIFLARRLGGGGTFSRRVTLGFATTHGALALLVLAGHFAGASLGVLLATLAVLSLAAAFLPPGTKSGGSSAAEGPILLAGTLLLVMISGARIGYRTDAWDHIGSVRNMEARGDLLAGEYFHADRATELDPRKGTNHTLFALSCRLTGIDPLRGWNAFRAVHVFFFLCAFLWFSRAVLGGGPGAWAGATLLALFGRFGPAGDRLAAAGYPGTAGYILFLAGVALALDAFRRGDRNAAPFLAGAGAAGIHIFYPVLAGAAFAVFLLLPRSLVSRFGSRATFGRAAALFLAGAAPFFLFRLAVSYHTANPLHLHTQGVLLLPFGLSILDHRGLAQVFGPAGWLSLLLLPFLRLPGRPWEAGELFLAATWAATLLILVNPFLFPVLENRLGYLTRRFALLAPWPLVLGAILTRPLGGPRTARTVIPALFAAGAVLLSFSPSSALRGGPVRTGGNAVADGADMAKAIDTVGEMLPPRSTLLTDPVTGYVLYGRTLLLPTAVIDQHSSPNDALAAQRIADTQRALHPRWDERSTGEIVDRLGADYVLVNEMFKTGFHTWNVFIDPANVAAARRKFDARPDRYRPLDAPEDFHLYRVERSGEGDSAGGKETARPAATESRGWETAGRPTLLGASVEPATAAAGELVHLTASWLAPEEGAGPLPMNLYVRAVPEGESVRRRVKPWAVRRLGGDADPYLLWEGNYRAVTEDGIRIPAGTRPGRYRFEIALRPFPFFPVDDLRRLNSPRGGASPWANAGTVEVTR